MGLLDKIRAGLKRSRDALGEGLGSLLAGRARLDEALLETLEERLVASDVGLATAERLIQRVRERARGQAEVGGAEVRGWLAEDVAAILREAGSGAPLLPEPAPRPAVILVVGVNGVGKTTTIGKVAWRLTQAGQRVLVVACDTFRAAAAQQLEIWAGRAGADILRQREGADPAAVAFDGLKAAVSRDYHAALFDTAGRLHTKVNLMQEVGKIRRVLARELPGAPHQTWLVLDAVTGQNGLAQARQFYQDAGVTGLIVTKLDGTARGGIVVAIAAELKLPVKLVGVGEGLDDLLDFDPGAYAEGLFGVESGE
ncbi:MAG TPA: signal recognition particle-docking protein FtsY [Candidatus Saccharimonadales bacterium]|nr:signal recognition particle-docking protein FtsY [Candidatus Saccharimonadales bacterium]